jgi:hypothetical protein
MFRALLNRLFGRDATGRSVSRVRSTGEPGKIFQRIGAALSGAPARVAGLAEAERIEPPEEYEQDVPLLLLGIDFGTAFTKAVWRDWGGVRVGVAPLGADGAAMAPSVVWVDDSGGLHLSDSGGARAERLLKMRLASGNQDDGNQGDIAALCVFFVGSVLRAAMAPARKAFRGRPVMLYGASVGCPAEYCDDGRVTTFQSVAAQAWRWAHADDAPRSLDLLKEWMRGEGAAAELFEARAEVTAAVDCFTMRPDAEEGRYVFLDVGAGTLDGAVFILYREAQRLKVTVLSTAVAPLGVEMMVRAAAIEKSADPASLRDQLFQQTPLDETTWRNSRGEVGKFVGSLILAARKRDPIGDWLRWRDARPHAWISLEDKINLARRLPAFFGGGGAACSLYRAAADQASRDLEKNYILPRLALGEIAPPDGFEGARDVPFHRFAVAYGLTRPFTDTPTWTLPSRLAAPPVPRVIEVSDRLGVDYGSNKDAYD